MTFSSNLEINERHVCLTVKGREEERKNRKPLIHCRLCMRRDKLGKFDCCIFLSNQSFYFASPFWCQWCRCGVEGIGGNGRQASEQSARTKVRLISRAAEQGERRKREIASSKSDVRVFNWKEK